MQPFIENAIIHGVIPKKEMGSIAIDFTIEKESLVCIVEDNGIGFDYESKKKKSFGLTNIQNRVQEVNGSLQVESNEAKGTNYSITVKL